MTKKQLQSVAGKMGSAKADRSFEQFQPKAQPNKAALATRKPKSGWLNDPRKEREREKIGGGFFIFRRGGRTGRIRPSKWPFEYRNLKDATDRADILARRFPGETFIVVGELEAVHVSPGPTASGPDAPGRPDGRRKEEKKNV
ncbi:hypothetical protein KX928_23165 [Roseobacter sp. YSTF-M11]|uniref:Uncharacterized protein n=1 Tax=Roseobacter insulae TaxID=2859783 RepID=A0A9X1K0W3_9RHOB|nr:hypothetical protein [Roseobacter insulae]MBW4710700.1 hypothetical protein [Roseobacter insulae]